MITVLSTKTQRLELQGALSENLEIPGQRFVLETGTATFSLVGLDATGWTRDTISVPVGEIYDQYNLVAGVATVTPASFWVPQDQLKPGAPATERPSRPASAGGSYHPFATAPALAGIGFEVDAATVAQDAQRQPVMTVMLGVLGLQSTFHRIAYSVHLHYASGGIAVIPQGR